MRFLLDTTAFSDLLRENPATVRRLIGLPEADTAMLCTVVLGEVLFGLAKLAPGQRRALLAENTKAYLEAMPCEPVSQAVAERYASVKLVQQRKGLSLGENDLWIVATALELGATVVSRDSDFRQVAGLAVVDWSKDEEAA